MTKHRSHATGSFPTDSPCPCGRPHGYGTCCGRMHVGTARAVTAEDLMRSRYSAFVVGDQAYLLRSWHPDTRPARVGLDRRTLWTGLEILGTTEGTPFHKEGTVEFRARYREGGRDEELREHSRFRRHEGEWVYLDALGG
ncbi:YchJ family protein [Nocardiopsis alkaliphila]|uniref:YchJ family protein n=1 Tax=Nocardiopsis alkaliphila TaxID=225762 RepID=UPI000475BB8A|nr:YchJ family metal-binding protein [Nocardiopsis alkaliphila]